MGLKSMLDMGMETDRGVRNESMNECKGIIKKSSKYEVYISLLGVRRWGERISHTGCYILPPSSFLCFSFSYSFLSLAVRSFYKIRMVKN